MNVCVLAARTKEPRKNCRKSCDAAGTKEYGVYSYGIVWGLKDYATYHSIVTVYKMLD